MKANRFRSRTWMKHAKEPFMMYNDDRPDSPLLRLDGKDILLYDSFDVTESVIRMFSTGLLDKNGKEIFEGDIVFHPTKGKHTTEWLAAGFVYRSTDSPRNYTLANNAEWEVIGNIYENPELLKEERDG